MIKHETPAKEDTGAATPEEARPSLPPDHLGFDLPPPAVFSKTRLVAAGAGLALVLGAAFLSAYLPRRSARAELEASVHTTENAAPRVEVLTPQVVGTARSMSLPGSVLPLEETVIYPRANGYVKKWLVDIGDKVTEGQLLAEIETPEIDQELLQARAQLLQVKASLIQAQANRDLSQSSLKRTEALVTAGVASQQELDQRKGQARVDEASVAVAQANIHAQEANIQRISNLKGFAKVVAPFGGTVTSRTVERGALVSAGNGTPLFKIAATDPVRVIVGVPQDVAPAVRVDQPAKVTVREFAEQPFQGTIARTSGALDPASRTMTTEVRVPNPEGKLMAGMFAQVALSLAVPRRILELPSTVLFNDSRGLRVAVVDVQNKIHFVPITLERDTGATIQIAAGLEGSERIVKLASAELAEGATVEVMAPEKPAK